MTDEELSEMWDNILPPWASAKNKEGDYTIPFSILPTKDGRRTGNAVMLKPIERSLTIGGQVLQVYLVVTDVGNFINLTLPELQELFYLPKWIAHKNFFEERLIKLEEANQEWKNSSRTEQD